MTLQSQNERVTPDMVHETGSQVMFGSPRDVDFWSVRIRKGMVKFERWQNKGKAVDTEENIKNASGDPFLRDNAGIPLAVRRNGRQFPIGDSTQFRNEDEVAYLVSVEKIEEVHEHLQTLGWQRITADEEDAFTLSLCRLPSDMK
jgi:hypothetical protein